RRVARSRPLSVARDGGPHRERPGCRGAQRTSRRPGVEADMPELAVRTTPCTVIAQPRWAAVGTGSAPVRMPEAPVDPTESRMVALGSTHTSPGGHATGGLSPRLRNSSAVCWGAAANWKDIELPGSAP